MSGREWDECIAKLKLVAPEDAFVCYYAGCAAEPEEEVTRLYCASHAHLEAHRPPTGTILVEPDWSAGWNARHVESLVERERARVLGFVEGRASARREHWRRLAPIAILVTSAFVAGFVLAASL